MISKKLYVIIMTLIFSNYFAQDFSVDKIEPPNWWGRMNLNKIQLMVYGSNLNGVEAKFTSEKIKVVAQHFVENNSYMFIDIELDKFLKAGEYELILSNGDNEEVVSYPILHRRKDLNEHNGFDNNDAVYLLMPDRFVNGDPGNDFVDGYNDKMQDEYAQSRHGGDIQGVINKLDYLQSLGFTTL